MYVPLPRDLHKRLALGRVQKVIYLLRVAVIWIHDVHQRDFLMLNAGRTVSVGEVCVASYNCAYARRHWMIDIP